MIDTVALLLADRSPALRLRALVEVDGAPADDPEVVELRAQLPSSPEVAAAAAEPNVSHALSRLGFLGLGRGDPVVDGLAERLLAGQQRDGSWLPAGAFAGIEGEGYQWRCLQTALPLRGLCDAGYADDPRAERAFGWLFDRRLDDGSFPYGLVQKRAKPSGVAGYRRLPRSEGCRATTTGVLACLARHPVRRTSEDARTALDLLLQRETREESTLGHEVARLTGVERPRGFATFYARFDVAFLLDLASRIGASRDDDRVADLVTFLDAKRGPHGLWEHPAHPHLSRWLTVDLLASLRRIEGGDWSGRDLRTTFRPYPRRRRRS